MLGLESLGSGGAAAYVTRSGVAISHATSLGSALYLPLLPPPPAPGVPPGVLSHGAPPPHHRAIRLTPTLPLTLTLTPPLTPTLTLTATLTLTPSSSPSPHP